VRTAATTTTRASSKRLASSMLSSSSSAAAPSPRASLSPSAASPGVLRMSRRRTARDLPTGTATTTTRTTTRGAILVTRAAPAIAAAAASQPGLAAIVAWASAALSAALTVFLLCAIPTLVVRPSGVLEWKERRAIRRLF